MSVYNIKIRNIYRHEFVFKLSNGYLVNFIHSKGPVIVKYLRECACAIEAGSIGGFIRAAGSDEVLRSFVWGCGDFTRLTCYLKPT